MRDSLMCNALETFINCFEEFGIGIFSQTMIYVTTVLKYVMQMI